MADKFGVTNKFPHLYRVNGVDIASQIFLPGLPETISVQDPVFIFLGETPETLESVAYNSPLVKINDGEFLLNIPGCARYHVHSSQVCITPYTDEFECIRIHLLSTVLGFLLQRSKILSLHAAAIRKEDKAYLLAGHSSSGKSALGYGLHKRGFEIISDDISSISLSEGKISVFEGTSNICVWEDILLAYEHSIFDVKRVRHGLRKYIVPTQRSEVDETILHGIFFLSSPIAETNIAKTVPEGVKAFDKLRTATFGYNLMKNVDNGAWHFQACMHVIANVPIHILHRPDKMPARDFVDYVETQIDEL